MQLVSLKAEGFRSLRCIEMSFEPLTILIGENDAGKSSVLDIISLFLSTRLPDPNDYYTDPAGQQVSSINIILELSIGDEDIEAFPFALDGKMKVRKIYTHANTAVETSYLGEKPADESLSL